MIAATLLLLGLPFADNASASGRANAFCGSSVHPVFGGCLRLKPGSAAVDAGEALPGVNDGFAGKSPDLGRELPRYGPRPEKK